MTPKAPSTPPPPPTSQGSSPHVQVLRTQPFCAAPFSGEAARSGTGALSQLTGTKPTINLHKKQERTPSPSCQPPTKERHAGVQKLTRSQKTEVIQAQGATGEPGHTKEVTQGRSAFNNAPLFPWPGVGGWGGAGAVRQEFCALSGLGFPLRSQVWGVSKSPE